jgi:RNA polymerase sigma-70 factor, ECF subfamily
MDIARLVSDHHQAVYAYAFRLSGSAAEAEDLTQHVFLVAQQKLGQLRKVGSAKSWLFTILRNAFLKQQQRPRPVPAANLGLNLDTIPADAPPEEDIDREALQRALGQLPPGFRVVLVMYYFEGLAYREIAEKLDLPIGTVMSRLARAKGRLRSRLFGPAVAAAHSGEAARVR